MVLTTAGWCDLSRATASMSRRALAGDRNDDYVPVRINSKSGDAGGSAGHARRPEIRPAGKTVRAPCSAVAAPSR
jgi:hypothetical protein